MLLFVPVSITDSILTKMKKRRYSWSENREKALERIEEKNTLSSSHRRRKQASICWPDSEPLDRFCLLGLIPETSAKVADYESTEKVVRAQGATFFFFFVVVAGVGEMSVLWIPGQWECLENGFHLVTWLHEEGKAVIVYRLVNQT